MNTLRVKFAEGNKSTFYTTLKERVDQYFEENNTTRFANKEMVLKSVFFFSMIVISYILILMEVFPPWGLLPLVMVYGLSSAFFVFNVAHDASHGAYSSNKKINKLLTYTWNFVGISSHIWNLKHNVAHHNYTNVAGSDQDIEQGFLLRFNPYAKRKSHHRFQHLYAPILYGLFSMFLIFVKDFQMYTYKRFGNKIIDGHPAKEWIILFTSKIFYVGFNIVIPLLVMSIVWWQFMIGFVLMHVVIGNAMAFILTPVHITEGTTFTIPEDDGMIEDSWAVHQIHSTIDMSPDSRLLHFLSGGLNTHITHHIFPHICHIHYYNITKILKQTAEEFGMPYRKKSLGTAMADHLAYLRDLGKYDVPPSNQKIAA